MEPRLAGQVEGHDLPLQLTTLVGRDREVRLVVDALERPDVRLLTLTGPGGAGKTRLALAASARLLGRFSHGVYFVDLSAILDHTLAPSTIARAVGLHEIGELPLVESMLRHLQDRSALVVLDNFEQVIQASSTVARMLAACPRLKILVTSRAPLRLTGEHEYPVPPLSCPDIRQLPAAEALTQFEAVALFVQRAQSVRPDFQVTAGNAASIAELCARLDGLPLAIELAAARVKLLPPEALLARLGNRLDLLTGGARDRPARQQTLRGAIAWSYDLLDEAQRALFARLGVFVGGASIEAIERVCNVEMDDSLVILDRLSSLVDESLVRRIDGPDAEPRFDLLESIREYALDRLAARNEVMPLRGRHAAHLCLLAEEAEAHLKGPDQREWLDRLAREHANARAALAWALDQGDHVTALRLAGALGPFWQVRDHLTEGLDWLERALAPGAGAARTDVPSGTRAKALNAAGALAFLRGDHARAEALQHASIGLWQETGDNLGRAAALQNLARAVHYQQQYERARALYEETLALRRSLNDRRGMAATLNSLGVLMRDCLDDVRALTLYQESLALHRELQDLWGQALLLNNMSRIARDAGQYAETKRLSIEALDLFVGLGDRHGVTWVVSNLAIVAQREGDVERSARLVGAIDAIRESLAAAQLSLSPGERAIFDDAVALAADALGADYFRALKAAGRASSIEEIVAVAREDHQPARTPDWRPPAETGLPRERRASPIAPLSVTPTPESAAQSPSAAVPTPVAATLRASSPDSHPDRLTRREAEVAAQVARGLTNKEIARELVISEGTVGVHLERIFRKLGVRTRSGLAAWVVEQAG